MCVQGQIEPEGIKGKKYQGKLAISLGQEYLICLITISQFFLCIIDKDIPFLPDFFLPSSTNISPIIQIFIFCSFLKNQMIFTKLCQLI